MLTERELKLKSAQYRKTLLRLIKACGAGHTGGDLSCLDILNVLYNRIMRVSPETMKKDTAIVTSCHEHDVAGTWRINLKWQGNHEILDFDLDRLGVVQRSEPETEHSGYVIVKSNTTRNIGDTIPLR